MNMPLCSMHYVMPKTKGLLVVSESERVESGNETSFGHAHYYGVGGAKADRNRRRTEAGPLAECSRPAKDVEPLGKSSSAMYLSSRLDRFCYPVSKFWVSE